MVDDPSAAGNGDSEDIDFPADPNPSFSAAPGGERRPLFQRLWTDEDEIVILRGFAEFTAQRGTAFASHQYDTTPFYEDMRARLQTGFTKSQLVEKLRRLKRKYRNCVDRLRVAGPSFSFRSPHEQAVFEIARAIWRPASDKHGRDSDSDDVDARLDGESARSPSSRPRRPRRRRAADFPAADAAEALPPAPVPAMATEDALPSFPQPTAMDPAAAGLPAMLSAAAAAGATAENPILASLFKELFRSMLNIISSSPQPGLERPPAIPGMPLAGEKWRQQRILELQVYLRRIALLQDQAQAALEELRSSQPHHGAGCMNNT